MAVFLDFVSRRAELLKETAVAFRFSSLTERAPVEDEAVANVDPLVFWDDLDEVFLDLNSVLL